MAGERNTLLVFLNETLVGRLRLLEGGFDSSEFRFERGYSEAPNRPVLGQTFLDDPRPRSSRVRIPAFFSNLLPEGALRELLARRAGVHPSREFFLIRELGLDLPGAIIVRPDGDLDAPPAEVGSELPAPVSTGEPLRFSLAGLQLKFSAERAADRWRLPVHGHGGRWLLKVADARHPDVPLNEWAMMTLASKAGLTVPSVELIDVAAVEGLPPEVTFAEPQALLVRRFDRMEGPTRIHTEDFLQVLDRHPDGHDVKYRAGSYDQLARVTAALGGVEDLKEFVQRLAFNAFIGNGDAHLKNWSLWYPDARNARLAPAYDLVSTIQYIDDPSVALKLSGLKRYDELGISAFTRLAAHLRAVPGLDQLDVDEKRIAQWVDELVSRARGAWRELAGSVPARFVDRFERHWREVPLIAGEAA